MADRNVKHKLDRVIYLAYKPILSSFQTPPFLDGIFANKKIPSFSE